MSEDPYKFEHDGPDPLDELDEAMAAEMAARQRELDERDAAASEGHGRMVSAWGRDTSLIEAHRAMGELFDNTLAQIGITKAMRSAGLPDDVQTVTFTLDRLSGPLVIAGLVLLGMYFPELRSEIHAVLSSIPKVATTAEEKALLVAAIEELHGRETEELKQAFNAAGIELRRQQDENSDADFNMN